MVRRKQWLEHLAVYFRNPLRLCPEACCRSLPVRIGVAFPTGWLLKHLAMKGQCGLANLRRTLINPANKDYIFIKSELGSLISGGMACSNANASGGTGGYGPRTLNRSPSTKPGSDSVTVSLPWVFEAAPMPPWLLIILPGRCSSFLFFFFSFFATIYGSIFALALSSSSWSYRNVHRPPVAPTNRPPSHNTASHRVVHEHARVQFVRGV